MTKKFLLVQFLEDIKKGLAPSQIANKYNLSKQNVNYHVGKLINLGCIEKEQYGVWNYIKPLKEVKKVPRGRSIGQHKKQIRGHAFIWKIEFYNPIIWAKHLINTKIPYNVMWNGKVFRIIFRNRKIWLTAKGLIIYEPLDFYGGSSFKVKGTAVYEMDKLIKALLKRLKIKLTPYKFTTSREHYGIIKNDLAKQYNDKKEKLQIKSEDGDVWLWIDDSLSLNELETKEPVVNRQVQNWFNDHRKHNFQVTPSFVVNQFNNLIEDRKFWAEHQKTHVKAIQQIGNGVDKLTILIEKLYRKKL